MLLLIMLLSHYSYARDSTGYSRIYYNYTRHNYLNKQSVVNDDRNPNPILAYNTMGYSTGLSFERVTRYGLMLGAGIHYGIKKYALSFYYDLREFDPDLMIVGDNYRYISQLSHTLQYIGPRITVGYRQPVGKDWALVGRLGQMLRFNLYDGYNDEINVRASYLTTTGEARKAYVMEVYTNIGNNMDPVPIYKHVRRSGSLVSDAYIGIERRVTFSRIRNISVGIEATNMLLNTSFKNHVIEVRSEESWNTLPANNPSVDRYLDMDISIGLRIAVGFW
jgi:hypothetical protein